MHYNCPYQRYYAEQAGLGDSIPVFQGSEYQAGHGLGSILGGIFRSALPLLKKGAAYLGKQVLNTGMDIVKDAIFDRKNIKESAKDRLRQAGHRLVDDVSNKYMSGSGRKRRAIKRKRKQQNGPKSKRRKKAKDIFD